MPSGASVKQPELPDFAALMTQLNQTQYQRDNPALYNILKELIARNTQSQQTIVNTTIPTAISTAVSSIPVTVSPLQIITLTGTIIAIFGNRNTTPLTIVTPAAGSVVIPVSTFIMVNKPSNVGFTNGANSAQFVNAGSTTLTYTLPNGNFAPNWAAAAAQRNVFVSTFTIANGTIGQLTTYQGSPLKLTTTTNISDPGGADAGSSVSLSVAYYVLGGLF